jgi:hypothetical protein
MLQSVTYLVKPEWPKIALIFAMARLANDMWLALWWLVTPDFAPDARGLLAPPGQPYKIYCGKPRALSQAPAAEARLRAHDRHVIATFRSAQCHF